MNYLNYSTVKSPLVPYPIYIRPETSDSLVFQEIFEREEYNCSYNGKVEYIIDGGANIGLASIFYINKYPEVKIVAIEPEKSNLTLLYKNIKPYSNIQIIEGALWNKEVQLKIDNPKAQKWAFRIKEEIDGEIKANTIPMLIKLLDTPRIDILKLDIEGGEKELFQNNNSWLHKVKNILIEIHDRFNPGTYKVIMKITTQYGFTGTQLSGNKGKGVWLFKND